MQIHQSDLSSMNRCGEAHRRQLNGQQGKQLSATAFGSVMHHALHTLERTRDLELAISTFEHFWHPLNIDNVCSPVEIWIGRQSYGQMRAKGVELLKRYWDLKRYDSEELMALEIPFIVPIGDTGHTLAGTIDRLALRKVSGRAYLCIDDWKTGKKPFFLPFNIQHIAYCYATTQPEFWEGVPEYYIEGFPNGTELFAKLAKVQRRGYWIDLSGTTPKFSDCGVKTEREYKRFFYAVDQYVRMREAEIFPLAIKGDVCGFCHFQDDCPEGL